MEVMNCRNCKRLFNYITGPMICPAKCCMSGMQGQTREEVWRGKTVYPGESE